MNKIFATVSLCFVFLMTQNLLAADEQSDSNELANKGACKASGGNYLWGAPQPRCKCSQAGMINNWGRGTESKAADICVPDPKAKKAAAPKVEKEKAPKPEPVPMTVSLDPEENRASVVDTVKLTLSVNGAPKGTYTLKVVCDDCSIWVNDTKSNKVMSKTVKVTGGHYSEEFLIVALNKRAVPSMVTATLTNKKGVSHDASARITWEAEKSRCEKDGYQKAKDGTCDCPLGFDRVQVDGEWTCKKHEPTPCEISGGEDNLVTGHCDKCSERSGGTMIEGKDPVTGKFICVKKIELPKPVPTPSVKIERFEHFSGVYAHLALGGKFMGWNSRSFDTMNGYFQAGAIVGVTPRLELDAMFSLGWGGALRTDANGEPVPNENGKAERRKMSAVFEGGVGYWFTDYVGAHTGVVFNPIGITNSLHFLHAGIGWSIGPQFRWVVSRHAAIVVMPEFFLGEHLKGDTSEVSIGGMLSAKVSLFNYNWFFGER